MTDARTQAAVDTVIRLESARLIAGLARYTGDIGMAEDLAQDAVVAALEQWPAEGVPRNAGAWLMTVAKRRAIDTFRRNRELEKRYAQLARTLEAEGESVTPDFDRAFSDHIDDDLLRLIFTACHPVLSLPARTALTLRMLGGLTTTEIARAYLVPESTIAQRIVRAKKTLAQEHVPFEVPAADDRPARLSAVLEVIYLVFNEGYSATAGDDWTRPDLCAEAVRLARVLAQLMPAEPEVHGLAALLEIQSSRLAARTGPDGSPVLLLDQDRRRWDRLLINRGLAALRVAEDLAASTVRLSTGRTCCRRSSPPATRRVPAGGHRLAADSRALRDPGPGHALAGGGAQPGGRGVHGRWPAGRAGPGRSAGGRARAQVVPPAAQRPRRPAGEARPDRGGAGRVRARGGARPERAGTAALGRPGQGRRTGLTSSAATANSRNREQFCPRSAGAYAIIIRRTGQLACFYSQPKWGRNGV